VNASSPTPSKQGQNPTPFVEISRSDWAELGNATELPLTEAEISQIRGLGDFLDIDEVKQVYLPLSRFLNIYVSEYSKLHRATSDFLGERSAKVPFVIGIAGSVAVGKSTVSRLLRELLKRWEGTPKVALITTDGFLYPNAELEKRSLMHRKGFPESYDRLALLNFVADIKSGKEQVKAPVYSHLTYDIVPDEFETVSSPDVVIIEGLNVLQAPGPDQEVALSDYFDFKIYVDAETENISKWFLNRFHELRESAFTNPASYFHRYAEMPLDKALDRAREIWKTINLPNLTENILPTRSRATLVLKKGDSHKVESVLLRKL
jgi:type I pantothenate kinase